MKVRPADAPTARLDLTDADLERMRAGAMLCMRLEGCSLATIGVVFYCSGRWVGEVLATIPADAREAIARSDKRLWWRENIPAEMKAGRTRARGARA